MAPEARGRPVSIAGPLRFSFLDEVGAARGVEQFARDHRFPIRIPADVDDLGDQIARMTGAHLNLARPVVLALEILDHDGIECEALPPAVELEDPAELVEARVLRQNLVRDTA